MQAVLQRCTCILNREREEWVGWVKDDEINLSNKEQVELQGFSSGRRKSKEAITSLLTHDWHVNRLWVIVHWLFTARTLGIRWNQQVVCVSWTKGSIFSVSHSYTLTQAVFTIIQKVVRFTEFLILSIKDYKAHNSVPESRWNPDSLEPGKVCLEKSLHVCLGFVHSLKCPWWAIATEGI